MPPRKSGASTVSVAISHEDNASEREEKSGSKNTFEKEGGISVEDLSLPRTLIHRLAKGVLPPNTSIQRDALLALSKAATVFISYISSTANETLLFPSNVQSHSAHQRTTIQPQDVIEALKELEFEGFVDRCEAELKKYMQVQSLKRNDYRRRVKEAKEGTGAGVGAGVTDPTSGQRQNAETERGPEEETDDEGEEEVTENKVDVATGRARKRARKSEGSAAVSGTKEDQRRSKSKSKNKNRPESPSAVSKTPYKSKTTLPARSRKPAQPLGRVEDEDTTQSLTDISDLPSDEDDNEENDDEENENENEESEVDRASVLSDNHPRFVDPDAVPENSEDDEADDDGDDGASVSAVSE